MEIYADMSIRNRIDVRIGNPIIKTEEQVEDYNNVCELVRAYDIKHLEMSPTGLEIEIGTYNRKIKYPANATVLWMKKVVKETLSNVAYKNKVQVLNIPILSQQRSAGVLRSVRHAFTQNVQIIKSKDNVIITGASLTYVFNLNNLVLKDRNVVEDLIKLYSIEALVKKHNLK